MFIDARRRPRLNWRMKARPILCFTLLALLLCAGCARNYNITTSSGHVITAHGKPHYSKANGSFVFKDVTGQERSIPAGSVSQIAPASDKSSATGFNPKPMR